MSLAHGGHLTHGSPVNLSGKYFEFHSYGVEDDTETIDYDHVEAIAKEVPAQDDCGRGFRLPPCHRL